MHFNFKDKLYISNIEHFLHSLFLCGVCNEIPSLDSSFVHSHLILYILLHMQLLPFVISSELVLLSWAVSNAFFHMRCFFTAVAGQTVTHAQFYNIF
jgi:hypothetical protein